MAAYYLAPALRRLRDEVNALWPQRDRSSDGWIGDTSHQARKSDHNPDRSAGGIVRAWDCDENLTPGGEASALVAQIIRDPRVAYVIYEGRIWENPAAYPGRGYWRTYTGANAHRQHVHVSVRRGTRWDSDPSPWRITRTTSAGGGGLRPLPTIPTLDPLDPLTPLSEEDDDMRIIDAGEAGSYLLSGGRLLGLDADARATLTGQGVDAVSITRERYLQWIAGTGPGVLLASPGGAYVVSVGGTGAYRWVPDMAQVDDFRARGFAVVPVSQAVYDALTAS